MIKLLIENAIFPENESALIKAAKSLQIDCCVWNSKLSYPPYKNYDNRVFFYGSVLTAAKLKRNDYHYQIWYGDPFSYGTWAGHLFAHILNDNFRILPYGALKNSKNIDPLFIKSNSPAKSVCGDVQTIAQLKALNPSLEPSELLVVASTKQLGPEYRFIVSASDEEYGADSGPKYTIVDHSSYGWDDEPYTKAPPKMVDDLADILSTNFFHPYPMWSIDLTQYGGSTKIVELNALSTCGLYGCDPELVLKEIVRTCEADIF